MSRKESEERANERYMNESFPSNTHFPQIEVVVYRAVCCPTCGGDGCDNCGGWGTVDAIVNEIEVIEYEKEDKGE